MKEKCSDIQAGSDFKLRSSTLLHVFAKYFLFMEQSAAIYSLNMCPIFVRDSIKF